MSVELLNLESIVFLTGGALLLAGLTGGNLVVWKISIPKLGLFSKIFCGVIGFFLMVIPVSAYFLDVGIQTVASKPLASEIEIVEMDEKEPLSSILGTTPLYASMIKLKKQKITLSENSSIQVDILGENIKIYAGKIPNYDPPSLYIHLDKQDAEKVQAVQSKSLAPEKICIPIEETKGGYEIDLDKLNSSLEEFEIRIYRMEIKKIISIADHINSVEILIFIRH